MTVDEKVYGLLGLACRAGQLVSGEFEVERQLQKGNVCAVLLDSDASANTRKRFSDACAHRELPICMDFEPGRLGRAIGRDSRRIAALKKGKLSEQILKLLFAAESV